MAAQGRPPFASIQVQADRLVAVAAVDGNDPSALGVERNRLEGAFAIRR